ncbi:hypothetical protein TNCT_716481 [Trichonephila clavata]|uniref:Uncharacterized protein n=1 Tax=Trichonephila clavata TaxID=2740835 RepID=A0A8X6H230_TRICU|nr:hypothetical protein TNCT_716481 [Trichonephila clavata]
MGGSNPRLQKWALSLKPFNFEIRHKQGKLYGNADELKVGKLASLARDLDESPDPSTSKTVLTDLITSSKYYKEEEAKESLEAITAERLETEHQ